MLAWIEIRRDELTADWELAVNGNPVFKRSPKQIACYAPSSRRFAEIEKVYDLPASLYE